MSIEFLPHTADIKIRVTANSLEALFKEGVGALYEYLKPKITEIAEIAEITEITKEIEIESNDLTTLFIDFLSEVLALTYIEKAKFDISTLISADQTRVEADANIANKQEFIGKLRLSATLRGKKFDSLEDDIKAVTYHQAQVEKTTEGYEAMFIVDV